MSASTEHRQLRGLSNSEAAQRLAAEGFNELPAARARGWGPIALDILREPMLLLLLACGGLYWLIGDAEEALLLLVFVLAIIAITFVQTRKTERALEALRDLSSPRALVLRGGEKVRVPGREVVRGDLLLLAEGDRVAADAQVLTCVNLSVDESLLTGESVPVRKTDAAVQAPGEPVPGGDDLPFVFSGTLVVQGECIARVVHTGAATRIGGIGRALRGIEAERTPLQLQTAKLVRVFGALGLAICAVLVAAIGLGRGDWVNGLLAGLTLAMALLPEEFPVVLTVFLALGAWRMSRRGVLTRRIPAVEALGAATALCVDKTGTLTLNRMSVRDLMVDGRLLEVDATGAALPEAFHPLVEYAIMAGPSDPFDPMEKAMHELGERTLAGTEHLHQGWTLLREYPLSRELLAMSRVWRSPDGVTGLIAAKGAPEAIADLCHLDEAATRRLAGQVEDLARRGRRVLAVAWARFSEGALPPVQHDFAFELLGLLGLDDPLRPDVPAAVRECRQAGVRVMMVTGDYPGTAVRVARQAGLVEPERVLTGPELEIMDEARLAEQIREVNVFARTAPEQKLRIVEALKRNGEVVAMTGDGVNDAPALKAAHIGIAMGRRGADVAREAADLVLVEDDFGSLVEAVRMGRRIFDNLRKAMMFIFSVHIPIAGMSLLPVLFGWPLALFPAHVVFLQLIIDPACSIVFEAEGEAQDIMRRPPRRLEEPLLGVNALVPGLVQGLVVLAIALAVYGVYVSVSGEAAARTVGFTTLVLCTLALIATNRAWPRPLGVTLQMPNAPLRWVSGGALVVLALVLYVPFLGRLFRVSAAGPGDLAVCVLAGAVCVGVFEGLKRLSASRPPSWRRH